jgi:hypothetical protein
MRVLGHFSKQVTAVPPNIFSYGAYTPDEIADIFASWGKIYFTQNADKTVPNGLRTLGFYCNSNSNPPFQPDINLGFPYPDAYRNLTWPEYPAFFTANFNQQVDRAEQPYIIYFNEDLQEYAVFIPNSFVTIVDTAGNVLWDRFPFNYFMRKQQLDPLRIVPARAKQQWNLSPSYLNVPIDWNNSYVELDTAGIISQVKELQAAGFISDPDTLFFTPFAFTFFVTFYQL